MTDSLVAALAKVQAKLPDIRKGETAEVVTKTGSKYKYSYADLASISKVILPLLGEQGLAWMTKPTFNEAGRFVLVYKLRHISGEEEIGEYPLVGNTPQEIGSAITYARRYTLCSMTGVAPEQDDDDGAAASRQAQQVDDWDVATPASAGQAKVFDDFARQIAGATSEEHIVSVIGPAVHLARSANEISAYHYEKLARAASARKAELEQAGQP